MSIRTYNKDHIKAHAEVTPATPRIVAPESDDPLVFWTQHEREPCEVNLLPFSTGQVKSNVPTGGGRIFVPFTGRPELILQLVPAIQEALLYAAKATVSSYMNGLREWWRVFDEVESAAARTGSPMARVEDVRLLTQVHSEYAHRYGIASQRFRLFRSLVDNTRKALGGRQTYWESPESPDIQKHIPPKEQRDAVRFAVRSICRSVLDRWAQSERLSQRDTKPEDPQEVTIWRNIRYWQQIQKKTGKVLPTREDVHDEIPKWARHSKGNFRLTLRESFFPDHWDADAVWHQCLLNTGWNSSTLTNLDATKKFLIDHIKDAPLDPHKRFVLSPDTYELVGEKARAGGKEQFVTGQWKSLDGPGHLIRSYLKRIEPLRMLLHEQLEREKIRYEETNDADYKSRKAQFAQIKNLEQGCRSVWLYVDRRGKVSWINEKSSKSGTANGKQEPFLIAVVQSLNAQREAVNARLAKNGTELISPFLPVPALAAKDFRVWFADYVYRSSHGNMLHVQRALNHSRPRTSVGYVDTTIGNQEASDDARRFLNILVEELDTGRIDFTILAHLYRYGKVTSEQKKLLAQARKLPKSRMNVACKDTRHPPLHIKATVGKDCDVQRCMLCIEHAILLPESMDGIAMRAEELRALQGFLPIETWIEEHYDIELKSNLTALRKFNLNQGLTARKKWALAIAAGEHYVPGMPLESLPEPMELE